MSECAAALECLGSPESWVLAPKTTCGMGRCGFSGLICVLLEAAPGGGSAMGLAEGRWLLVGHSGG